MNIAVGISSVMVAATAIMVFIGHSIQGIFESDGFLFTCIAVLGGLLGGKFAYTIIAAAVFMVFNALFS